MTLLISAITNNNAFLATDRRLAYTSSSGKVVLGDDDSCKLITYDSRFLFAYTGLSDLGGKKIPTDLWIARTLQHRQQEWSITKALEYLALKTEEQINKYPIKNMRFFTAICVGWDIFEGSDKLQPAFGHVSTYIDAELKKVKLKENNGSTVVYWSIKKIEKNKIPFVFTAGQEIVDKRLFSLKRHLRKCIYHNVSQNIILDYLYNEIIYASENNVGKNWIGKGVLSAAISLESVLQENITVSHGDTGSGQQFRYYHSRSKNPIFKGPHAVLSGSMLLTDVRGGYLEDENTQYVEATYNLPARTLHMPLHIPWTHIHSYDGPWFDSTTWWCSRPIPRPVS